VATVPKRGYRLELAEQPAVGASLSADVPPVG